MRTLAFIRRLDRGSRVAVAGGGVLVAILAVGWWELLFLPLGASHDGRINARFGLHVRNLVEGGLAGSDYLASMVPFSEQPYVHHPPLLNVMHALVGWFLGQGEWQLRLIGYLAGLVTVVGLLWLARRLELGAGATVLAVALVAGTPMFWIYARLGLGVSLMVILLGLWIGHLGPSGTGPARLPGSGGPAGRDSSLVVLAVVAGAVAFSSWTGALLVAVLAGWGFLHLGSRRIARLVAGTGAVMVLLTLVWAFTVGDAAELAAHAADRRQWPPWGALVENYRWFYGTLYPGWFRWLILPALAAAVVDRRTRMASGAIMIALGVWTLATPDAAFIHDYWTYPLLVPVLLGLAVILDRLVVCCLADRPLGTGKPGIGSRIGWKNPARVLGVAGLVLLAVLGFRGLAPYRQAYFDAPSDAGGLIRSVGPAPGQEVAWVAKGVDPLAIWVSYYWDLPVAEVPLGGDGIGSASGTDLVLVPVDRIPVPLKEGVQPVAEQGRYALFSAASLTR
ncbi:MAG: glycosyltransferase family 39 protein [bacterium]|nr:glycosyltransferase family 39 protein [bacterium]